MDCVGWNEYVEIREHYLAKEGSWMNKKYNVFSMVHKVIMFIVQLHCIVTSNHYTNGAKIYAHFSQRSWRSKSQGRIKIWFWGLARFALLQLYYSQLSYLSNKSILLSIVLLPRIFVTSIKIYISFNFIKLKKKTF